MSREVIEKELSHLMKYWKKESIIKLVNQKLSDGVPRQIIYNDLLKISIKNRDPDEMEAFSEVGRELMTVVVDRNFTGKQYEKSGHIDEVLALYEANVTDQIEGSHPYERLRIIYTKRKQYDDAIRVCEQYLLLHPSKSKKNMRFRHYLEMLLKKKR